MKFRPCIDIHNGKVKQIIGGTLSDSGSAAEENYVSDLDAGWYAALYRKNNLPGGHIIILNPAGTKEYELDLQQAEKALNKWPGGMMIGGGINSRNAGLFLDMGASHVIVTSYVFSDGMIKKDKLTELMKVTGKNRLVLDLSCRRSGNDYYIVTDRWQKFTRTILCADILDELSEYCSEFLIHAVDMEGKQSGIETDLVSMLGGWGKIPITYAGGISSIEDIEMIKRLGNNKLDFTIGSALDLFGGNIPFCRIKDY